jgi:hypothetical protein
MRRILLGLTITVTVLAMSTPAWATITLKEFVPKRDATPLEKACSFEVVATDRSVQRATGTFTDDGTTLLKRSISGSQQTVFEWVNSGATIAIETIGGTTISRNGDGTYTLVQKGSGYWFDDGSYSGIAELIRFTGTVKAVGYYDAKTFAFQPISRTISGVTSSICEMLVTGLKTRH